MQKKEQDKLVKIDSAIYDAMKEYVNDNKLDYPSMKHFVEKAIVKAIEFRKYDIEGTEITYDEKAPLKEVVGTSQRAFTLCLVCSRPFLRDSTEEGDASRICPNCKNTMVHFASRLVKKEFINPKKEERDRYHGTR